MALDAAYDLTPLRWWQNPWYDLVLVTCALVFVMLCLYIWRIVTRPRPKVIVPRDSALESLSALRQEIMMHERHILQPYAQLINILRKYLHASYGIGDAGSTDRELLKELMQFQELLPHEFELLFHTVMIEADREKFALSSGSAESQALLVGLIDELITSLT